MINCNDYRDDVYSGGGEDGIVAYLLTQIERTNFVIEFGAADGYHCSNTAALWRDGNVRALLIEANAEHFEKLRRNTAGYTSIEARCAYVTNIDEFTTEVADVCSIDVDGNDFHIAARMNVPHKIVLVEHNPTVPPHVEMVGIENTQYGSGALSIKLLMEHKGYTLVAVTKTNMIFLYGDHHDRFVTDLDVLFDRSSLNFVVTSYDGLYDTIGEFGYGYGRPANLRLKGREGEVSKTIDSVTQEYMRQMIALDEAKGTR